MPITTTDDGAVDHDDSDDDDGDDNDSNDDDTEYKIHIV